ncbi:DNA alkylation repair protein [uncultured Limosilactobacillus sp.]|uniref:DNA alkylation repair protein n=1 Tax=uncultured Limosilactobacillus sp. TaxID=2837629 RepID=UPI0025FA8C5D|nr:DNA alkylation repair protein [uncultured Limosilactobacillus sp.]
MKFKELKERFDKNANLALAQQMSSYMRDQFLFYGYQSIKRKQLYHQDLLRAKHSNSINWQLLDQAWHDPHREMQYFVCDYLIQVENLITIEDLPKIEQYLRTKQWWDTIDKLMKPIGQLGLRDHAVNAIMLRWSMDPDQWIRRVAIEYQLLRRDKTNINLLAEIIENNLGRREFFINKAIGWALRDYSKTNPGWVRQFIKTHHAGLTPLAIREASRYL